MADDAKMNGEFPDDRTLDISGYETPDSDSKTSALNEKIAALEQENRQLVHEKDVMEKRIADLKQSVDESNKGKEELKIALAKSESEVKTLESVARRAAELESEVSRLQHDLISTMSALEESNLELSKVKVALDEAKKSENEQGGKLDAIVKERDLLVKKYGELEVKESETREEVNGKEKEMRALKEKIEELKAAVAKNGEDKKEMEGERSELEKKVKELEGKVMILEKKLEEKERVINGFEEKEQAVVDGEVAGKGDVKDKGLAVGGKQMDWPVVAGSVVGAVGLLGVVCYLHNAKRS